MRIYEILDQELGMSIGVLLYYERKKEFIIELSENLDEWTAPLLFTRLVKNKTFTVPRNLSKMWVKERIIPIGRHNISEILKNHKLESYDEMRFLEISKGRCSQDSMYIKRISDIPEYVTARRNNIVDCTPCEQNSVICFFEDNTVKKVDLNKIPHVEGVQKILNNISLYNSCKVGTGGYSITFNDTIDIPAYTLYAVGETIPLSMNDFISFARNNLMDTSECCSMLECSRQNVSYMVKHEQLDMVKEDVKGNLYLRGNVTKTSW